MLDLLSVETDGGIISAVWRRDPTIHLTLLLNGKLATAFRFVNGVVTDRWTATFGACTPDWRPIYAPEETRSHGIEAKDNPERAFYREHPNA